MSSAVKSLDFLAAKAKEGETAPGEIDTMFVQRLEKFMDDKQLDVFAIMTSFTKDGKFQRELFVLASSENDTTAQIEHFVRTAKEQLELVEIPLHDGPSPRDVWRKAWRQGNVSMSRKQVAPMLRSALEQQNL